MQTTPGMTAAHNAAARPPLHVVKGCCAAHSASARSAKPPRNVTRQRVAAAATMRQYALSDYTAADARLLLPPFTPVFADCQILFDPPLFLH